MWSANWFLLPLMTMLHTHLLQTCQADSSYENMTALMDRLLGPNSGYNPDFRPRIRQTDKVKVSFEFSLISLEEINDVKQSFTVKGIVVFGWKDEKISWNEADYDGVDYLTPKPNAIWRPGVYLINTLGDINPFSEDIRFLNVHSDGTVWWTLGGIFEASSVLDMNKYPFDQQTCSMLMCPALHNDKYLTLELPRNSFDFSFFVSNEGWDLTESSIENLTFKSLDAAEGYSCINISFQAKRRSSYYVINLILPVLMLSFLNNFVFLIPDESGEKTGFGITVLLSLCVFLTTVSTMIPRASYHIPAVTIYLVVLLSSSVLSVLESIATVYLHHAEEDETEYLKAQDERNQILTKDSISSRQEMTKVESMSNTNKNAGIDSHVPTKNKYRIVTKYMNKICFFLSMSLWVIIQIIYFGYVLI